MIQVASPYEGLGDNTGPVGATMDNDLEFEVERMIQALDAWVERIKARYGDANSTWSIGTTAEEPARPGQPSAKVNRMLALVKRALRVEAEQLGAGEGVSETMTTKLLDIDIALWQDETTLLTLMKDIWRKRLRDIGMDEMGVDLFINNSDDTSVLLEVDQALTIAEEDLRARQKASLDENQEAAGEEQVSAATDQEKEVE